MDFLKSVEIAKSKLGLKLFKNLSLTYEKSEDRSVLVVKRDNQNVHIVYGDTALLFRGLTLIKEHASETTYEISFKRHFDKNGFMADCSRNGVLNLESLKELILIQALMGQNRLLLYTEDTYKLDKYPYFGYLRGGYTKEEIKEVVDYAEGFGVEVIPCIQTLGHLTRPLHWEPMIPLRDGPSTLLIDEEKVYEFIEEMIKFSREVFKSEEIHIGMDESTEIGLFRYLGKHPFTDRVELFSRHLDRVIKICQRYSFVPMIWSDMYFRLNEENEEYYRNTPLPKSTIKLIPKDVELVYWDYYHDDQKIYDDMISYHKDAKCPIIFAGGIWRWKGYAPSLQGSFKMSVPAIKSCVDNGIKSVFLTAWGDNGNECSMFTSLPLIALYSVADYCGEYSNELVDSLLKAVTGEPLERMLLLDLPDMPDNKFLLPQYNPSKYFLYQDVLNGMFDKQVKDHFASKYKEFSLVLNKASKQSKPYGYIYKTLSILCDILSVKVDMGVKLREAYKNNDKKALKAIVNQIPSLVKVFDKLNSAVYYQWNKENKSFGYDVLDGRLGYTKNRLLTTKAVVDRYLSGKIDKIEELETEILPYNGHDYEICWNWWATTVTVHNL